MARKMGRPREPGVVLYLGRLRVVPGMDPPELVQFAEAWQTAEPERKRRLLRAALMGGMEQAAEVADQVEDTETSELLDDLLEAF